MFSGKDVVQTKLESGEWVYTPFDKPYFAYPPDAEKETWFKRDSQKEKIPHELLRPKGEPKKDADYDALLNRALDYVSKRYPEDNPMVIVLKGLTQYVDLDLRSEISKDIRPKAEMTYEQQLAKQVAAIKRAKPHWSEEKVLKRAKLALADDEVEDAVASS